MTPDLSFTKVRLPYGWLSNMSPHPVTVDEVVWPTAEHLFQALRFAADDRVRQHIRAHASPMRAKRIAKFHAARRVVLVQSIQDVGNMRQILALKRAQHPAIAEALAGTAPARLIEDVSARPSPSGLFWGMRRTAEGWQGRNILGRLWMKLRDAPGGNLVSPL